MRKSICYFSLIFIISCSNGKSSSHNFNGYPRKLVAKGEITNDIENSLFEFYTNSNNERVSSGFYLNGLRNDVWYYNIDSHLIEIKWAPFTDKNLGFETNTFAVADTVFYGDSFTQIDYRINEGSVSLVVSINTALKDSLSKKRFRDIVSTELNQFEYSLNAFDSNMISVFPIFEYSSINTKRGKKIFSTTTYGFIEKDFVQITVSCTENLEGYKNILFEGVLTNLFFKKKRFYFPFIPY